MIKRSETPNDFYVYALLDPRKPGEFSYRSSNLTFDYEPFYIGKGRKYQMKTHDYEIKRTNKTRKSCKIRKIFKETKKLHIAMKLFENLGEEQSLELEKFLILQIGRLDHNRGPLTNGTDGGDGLAGYITPEEVRKKRRKENLSEELRYKFGSHFRGKKRPEHSKFLKDYYKDHPGPNTGKSLSEETRKKLSISGKGKKHNITKKRGSLSEEVKEKIRKANLGRKVSEETRQKMRNAKQQKRIQKYEKNKRILVVLSKEQYDEYKHKISIS